MTIVIGNGLIDSSCKLCYLQQAGHGEAAEPLRNDRTPFEL